MRATNILKLLCLLFFISKAKASWGKGAYNLASYLLTGEIAESDSEQEEVVLNDEVEDDGDATMIGKFINQINKNYIKPIFGNRIAYDEDFIDEEFDANVRDEQEPVELGNQQQEDTEPIAVLNETFTDDSHCDPEMDTEAVYMHEEGSSDDLSDKTDNDSDVSDMSEDEVIVPSENLPKDNPVVDDGELTDREDSSDSDSDSEEKAKEKEKALNDTANTNAAAEEEVEEEELDSEEEIAFAADDQLDDLPSDESSSDGLVSDSELFSYDDIHPDNEQDEKIITNLDYDYQLLKNERKNPLENTILDLIDSDTEPILSHDSIYESQEKSEEFNAFNENDMISSDLTEEVSSEDEIIDSDVVDYKEAFPNQEIKDEIIDTGNLRVGADIVTTETHENIKKPNPLFSRNRFHKSMSDPRNDSMIKPSTTDPSSSQGDGESLSNATGYENRSRIIQNSCNPMFGKNLSRSQMSSVADIMKIIQGRERLRYARPPEDSNGEFTDIKALMSACKEEVDFTNIVPDYHQAVLSYKRGDDLETFEHTTSKWINKSWEKIKNMEDSYYVNLRELLRAKAPKTMETFTSLAPKKLSEAEVLESWLIEGLREAYPNLKKGVNLYKNDAIALILLAILSHNFSGDQHQVVISKILEQLKKYTQSNPSSHAFPLEGFEDLANEAKKLEMLTNLREIIRQKKLSFSARAFESINATNKVN